MKKYFLVFILVVALAFTVSCGQTGKTETKTQTQQTQAVQTFNFKEYFPIEEMTKNVLKWEYYSDGELAEVYYEMFEVKEEGGKKYLYDYTFTENYERDGLDIFEITNDGLVTYKGYTYSKGQPVEIKYEPANPVFMYWNLKTDFLVEYAYSYTKYSDNYKQNMTLNYKVKKFFDKTVKVQILGKDYEGIQLKYSYTYSIKLEDGRSGTASYTGFVVFAKGFGFAEWIFVGKDWKDEMKIAQIMPVAEFKKNLK